LERIAELLQHAEIGDGTVHAAAARAQREIMLPAAVEWG